jgi:hypothetical protein
MNVISVDVETNDKLKMASSRMVFITLSNGERVSAAPVRASVPRLQLMTMPAFSGMAIKTTRLRQLRQETANFRDMSVYHPWP